MFQRELKQSVNISLGVMTPAKWHGCHTLYRDAFFRALSRLYESGESLPPLGFPEPFTGGFLCTERVKKMESKQQLAAIIQAITEQPEPRNKEITRELAEKYRIIAAADRASGGGGKYTEAEIDRALSGFTRAVITAAVNNIKNTTDLIDFLGDLSAIRWVHFENWLENEQADLAQSLF